MSDPAGFAADAAAEALAEAIGLRRDRAMERRLVRSLADAAGAAGRTADEHARALPDDPAALQDLIDRVTVQESDFFRHPEQFAILADHLRGRAAAAVPGSQRVVWCAGCAEGEEPWSVAMLLAELGLTDWRVVATDVSRRALERARAGVYDERQLRGLSTDRRTRFLRPRGGARRIVDALRPMVQFRHHALTTDPVPAELFACPVVLCRNVLIYLRADDARGLLDRLADRMRPDGLLLVGAGEALPPDHPSFVPERRRDAFVYRPRVGRPAPGDGPPAFAAPPAGDARPAAVPAAHAHSHAHAHAHAGARAPKATAAAAEHAATGERLAAAGAPAAAADAFRRAAYLEPANPLHHLRRALALESAGLPEAARAFAAARHALRSGDAPDPAALEGWTVAALDRLLADKLGAS